MKTFGWPRMIAQAGLLIMGLSAFAATTGEPLPSALRGSWRITRVLPTSNTACWGREQAAPLVGSTLTYATRQMRWKGGSVPLEDVSTRSLTEEQFQKESGRASFAELGIRARAVTEVDLQHEDMDITGSTTEVPGDAILLAGPNRIVVSACGVYFEATRSGGVRTIAVAR